jgi:micrococcal nuclease
MAQTPQAEATVTSTGQTTPPADGQPDVGLGNPTTIILLLFAVAIFWWSMRRRRAFEERMQSQRRAENMAAAEQSAREIAHIMRQAPPPGAVEAAAAEGLASAARMPATSVWPPLRETAPAPPSPAAALSLEDTQVRTSEQAEAAMEQGLLAAQRAEQTASETETAGESVARRLAAAEAVAAEVQADTADAIGAPPVNRTEARVSAGSPVPNGPGGEVPDGAIAGDGTPICPPRFPVKGNLPSQIYHLPGQVAYPQTVPEFCFASAEAAEAAGYRPSRSREEREPGS